MHRHPAHRLLYPLVQAELPEGVFFAGILLGGFTSGFDLVHAYCFTQRRIRFLPDLRRSPVGIVRSAVDHRVEGLVDLAPFENVLRLLVLFVADGIGVRACRRDQKIQRLHSCVAGAFCHNVKELPVRLGTTKLSKALEGVNKNIKNTQTQLKDVQKLLKLDPKNTELIAQNIKSTIATVMNTIKTTVSNIWDRVKNAVTQKIAAIKDTIVGGFNAAVNFIKDLGSQAFSWGADIIDGIVNGIKSCIDKVSDAVSGVADTIRSFLHFSVPDEGPLVDFESWMPDFMQGLAQGINKSKKYVEKAVAGVAETMKLTMQSDLSYQLDGVSSAVVGSTGDASVVNNYYNNDNSRTVNQTNNSPKSLSRLEIYRQTRNALNV